MTNMLKFLVLIICVSLVGCVATRSPGAPDFFDTQTGEKFDLDNYNSLQKRFFFAWYECREYAEGRWQNSKSNYVVTEATEKCLLDKGYKKIQ